MADRNLDGVFFRVEQKGKFVNKCFSDLTEEQMMEVLKNKDEIWLKNLAIILGKRIKTMGDQLDLMIDDDYDE